MKNITTIVLVIITSIVFTIHNIFPETKDLFILDPNDSSFLNLISSIFTHDNIFHFTINMLLLLIIGSKLESKIGSLDFISSVFIIGMLSNTIWMIFYDDKVLGMSGVIYGITAMFIVIYKHKKTYLLWLSKYNFSIIYLLITIFIIEVLSMIFNSKSDTAYLVHISGMILGTLYGMYFTKKKYLKIN